MSAAATQGLYFLVSEFFPWVFLASGLDICSLSLVSFNFSINELVWLIKKGTIPREIGNLTMLKEIILDGNYFNGMSQLCLQCSMSINRLCVHQIIPLESRCWFFRNSKRDWHFRSAGGVECAIQCINWSCACVCLQHVFIDTFGTKKQ